jgi:hypothetical protein
LLASTRLLLIDHYLIVPDVILFGRRMSSFASLAEDVEAGLVE